MADCKAWMDMRFQRRKVRKGVRKVHRFLALAGLRRESQAAERAAIQVLRRDECILVANVVPALIVVYQDMFI